jgi:glycosyltransferase involved in cell wall biosynthesis
VVIGHGRITGGAAEIQRERFPGALRVHVIHMAPDEIEWHKAAGGTARDTARTAEERTRAEVALALGADLVAAVGPVLSGRFEMELSFDPASPPVLRLDPGFMLPEERPRTPPPGNPIRVLVLGRLEDGDAVLKGLDIAAVAVAHASRYLPNGQHLELLVRGVPPGEGTALREQIRRWAGEARLRVVPREYTADAQILTADLRSSSLLLMPSLAEGFGFVGVEAIEAGTPLLASQSSGLGVYLGKVLSPEDAARVVVDDLGESGAAWGQEVLRVVRNRDAAFRDADRIRRDLAARRPWSAVADDLLTALAALPRAFPG